MKRSYRHEELILQEPVTMGLIASSIIGAGSSMYQGNQQKQAAEDAARKKEEEANRLKAEQDRIARETKPQEESMDSEGIGFGSSEYDTMGGYDDFITPLDTSGSSVGTAKGGSGLNIGFSL